MRPFSRLTAAALATLCSASAFAATYYVNPNSLGDGNSGTSSTWPWKTIAKVNATAVSGDTVYFYRGGVWNETLQVKSGVTYGAYGSNTPKPVISGSRYVGGLSWARTSATSNIWVATTNSTIETGAIRHLYLNGARLTRARHPNVSTVPTQPPFTPFTNSTTGITRYARIAATGDYTTLNIEAGALPAGADPTGATAFVRAVGSDLFESTVKGWKASSTSALDLIETPLLDDWGLYLRYNNNKDFGYWLENKLWMLDSPGEWYFDAPNHKLYVWAPNGASPANQGLYAASQANAVVGRNVSNVSLTNIEVRETLSDAISMSGASNVTLTAVDVNRSGRRGVSIWNASNITINTGNIQDSFGMGLWLGDPRGGPTASQPTVNANVSSTTINNSGQKGLGQGGVLFGIGGTFTGNTVSNSASGGVIVYRNTSMTNNTVVNSCTDFDDCGGIYVAQPVIDGAKLQAASPTAPFTSILTSNNLKIMNNIVSIGRPNPDGTPGTGYGDVRGIYLDDYVNGATVSGNYVSGVTYGIMLHTAFGNSITDNLLIGNRSFNLKLQEDPVRDVAVQTGQIPDDGIRFTGQMVGNTILHNGMVTGKNSAAPTLAIPNIVQNAAATANLASYDKNRYGTTNPNNPGILVYNYGGDVTISDMTLANWQAIGKDLQGDFRAYRTDGEAYGFYTATGAATRSIPCPAVNQANCNSFVNLLTGTAVTFPISLPANASVIVIR